MTVETDLDRAQYATNGTTGPWTVPFYFLANAELDVTYTNAAGVDTTLTLDVDFSVVGAGNPDGGTLTTTAGYVAGGRITILRDVPLTQETEYVDGDGFPAKAHERALDRLTMIAQQLRERVSRALSFGTGDTASAELPAAAQRAGYLLGFDANGAPMLTTSAATAAIGFTSEVQTAAVAQTVFNLTTTSYTPGGSNLAVFIDGLYIPPADYAQTSSTSITFSGVSFSGIEQVTFLCGRLVGVAANAANVSVQQAGTGTALRSVGARTADSRSINDYVGADATGATPSSSAFDNYATDTQSAILPVETKNHAPMIIDVGVYQLSARDFPHTQSVIGRTSDKGAHTLVLKAGETGSLLKFRAEDITGTSTDDTNRCSVRNLTLVGNQTDHTTVGVSHAIECPDAPYPIGTQYASSIEIDNVEIKGFTGNGIHLGVNRNWALISKLVQRYCNGDGIKSYGYDHRINESDFGQNTGTGVNLQAGGAIDLSGCNIYGNLINLQVTAFVNSFVALRGCSLDAALHDGALIAIGAGPVMFVGGRFYSSGQAADNTYADIHCGGGEIIVLGTQFLNAATGKRPKFTLQTDNTHPKVLWLPSYIDTSGGAATPFTSFLTDEFPCLRYAGQSDDYWGSPGPATLSSYIGGVEQTRIDSTGLSTFNAAQLLRALATLTNYAGAAAGTLTNAPSAGNPTKWIAINDNGTIRKIPTWT